MPERLPLIILAGSDERRSRLPPGMRDEDMLTGHKGLFRVRENKVLVAELIDRYMASGRFRDPVLVGPEAIYRQARLPCDIVDCDGNIADSLRAAEHVAARRFGRETPVAITTCDILPSADELQSLLASDYDPVAECVFWGQFVSARQTMGASQWKPSYRFAGDDAAGPTMIYPGHLVIVRTAALDTDVAAALVFLAYWYRNLPLLRRLPGMLLRGIAMLARIDLARWFSSRWSASAFEVPWYCVRAYARYRRGALTLAEFEHVLATTLVFKPYRAAAENRPVRFVLTDYSSFARDVDTSGELAERRRELACDSD